MRDIRVFLSKGLFLVVCLSILGAFATHSSESFVNYSEDGSCAAILYGDIESGDELLFGALTSQCLGGGLLLKSPGGDLWAGLKIGEIVRERDMETAVSYDALCSSACALAWLGGKKRRMFDQSRIGFHAAYTLEDNQARVSGFGNALVGAYLQKMGLSLDTIYFVTSAGPEEMNWLNFNGALQVGIEVEKLTDDDRPWIDALDSTAISNNH